MEEEWTVGRLDVEDGETKSLDPKLVLDAIDELEVDEVDLCPGSLGCSGIGEEMSISSATREIAVVSGHSVVWRGKRMWDAKGRMQSLVRGAFGVTTAMQEAVPHRCTLEKPPDFDFWTTKLYQRKNNCLNYAVGHRWDWRTGGARGPDGSAELRVWNRYFAQFGVEAISTLRDATDDGWPIALFLKPNADMSSIGVFHFLRLLPSGVWSHKFGVHPPALCDFSAKPIARDSLKSANLCGYQFASYYWVKKGTVIRNRKKDEEEERGRARRRTKGRKT